MAGKNFSKVLAVFLVIVLAFIAVQVINILNRDPLPANSQQKTQQVNPNLNQDVIDDLQGN